MNDLDISPSQFKAWLTRQGWVQITENLWELIDENRTEPWSVKVVGPVSATRKYFNAETIVTLAEVYCCQQWEIEAVLKVEPIDPTPYETVKIEVYGPDNESPDHSPVKIKLTKDGADAMIAALLSQRYGWGNSIEAWGRGGGQFTLTIEGI